MRKNTFFTTAIWLNIALVGLFLLLSSFSIGKGLFKWNSNIDEDPQKEKVYLHFDKSFYFSGEDIWFKVYLVNSNTHQTTSLSSIVYVDLIDTNNEIIDTRTIKTGKDGGAGEFYLPDNLHSGYYLIRAYTNYMRNFDDQLFFRKQFFVQSIYKNEISNPTENKTIKSAKNIRPDMQFFPEGGYMVNGISGRLGFKVLGVNGKGVYVSGAIIDENGVEINKFRTPGFGLGRIMFTPQENKTYKAHIQYENQDYYYDLPKSLDKGVTMMVEDMPDHFQIIIQSSLKEGVNDLLLLGKQQEKVIGRAKVTGSEKLSTINIPKTIFKQGIVQFTLIDKNNKPICERLSFVESNGNEPNVNITLSKNHFQKREMVEMELSFNGSVQKNIQPNISLAVTDISAIPTDKYGLDIRSYLLLTSDLRGNIESPGYYFMSKDPKRKEILDILMMTQGWRKFLFKKATDKNTTSFKHENGITFSGHVKNLEDKKNITSTVDLLLKNKWLSFKDSTQTNGDGHFDFGPYNIVDSTTFIIKLLPTDIQKSKRHKKSKMNYYIEFDKFIPPKVTFKRSLTNNLPKESENIYTVRSKTMQQNEIYQDNNTVHDLDEVVLKTTKQKRSDIYEIKKKKLGIIHMDASNTVSPKQLKYAAQGDLVEFLKSRIPGLVVQGNEILLRGRSTFLVENNQFRKPEKPLFILNNMATDFESIKYLQVEDIDFVEVLKGSRAAIYGSRANHGVIAIYTKFATGDIKEPIAKATNKFEVYEQNEIIRFIHPGYYKAREFYEPNYKTAKNEPSKPDLRTTIYWKPNIKFNAQGKAVVYFYTADIESTYKVDLQGITSDGLPITSEAIMHVK